jgi:hypothetical protein
MRPIPPAAVLVAASLLLQGGAAIAGEWDLGGSASVELRAFTQDPAFPNQDDSTLTWSSALEPEFVHEWEAGNDRLTFVPFARWDSHDENRTHADIRTASWLHFGDGWDLVVGLDRVFWGVTESRHLVDIVNQTDAVENVDGEDKLGQPMVNLNIESQWGDISLFALPGFREPRTDVPGKRCPSERPAAGCRRGDIRLGRREQADRLRNSLVEDIRGLGCRDVAFQRHKPRAKVASGP